MRDLNQLTGSQQSVIKTLRAVLDEGQPPTLTRLAGRLGITPGGVRNHLVRLRAMGVVTWEERRAGTLRVAEGVGEGR